MSDLLSEVGVIYFVPIMNISWFKNSVRITYLFLKGRWEMRFYGHVAFFCLTRLVLEFARKCQFIEGQEWKGEEKVPSLLLYYFLICSSSRWTNTE